jgi:hypothetical protein
MLYHAAFKAPSSVLEILKISRRSIWGCWSVLGMRSVPCQVPTMSVAEAGVDGCDAGAGVAVCDAGAVVCVYAHAPFPASSKTIAPAAQHVNPGNAFPQSRSLRPIRPILISGNPHSSPFQRIANDASLRMECEKDTSVRRGAFSWLLPYYRPFVSCHLCTTLHVSGAQAVLVYGSDSSSTSPCWAAELIHAEPQISPSLPPPASNEPIEGAL